jgi:hypothetical protein
MHVLKLILKETIIVDVNSNFFENEKDWIFNKENYNNQTNHCINHPPVLTLMDKHKLDETIHSGKREDGTEFNTSNTDRKEKSTAMKEGMGFMTLTKKIEPIQMVHQETSKNFRLGGKTPRKSNQ